MYMLSQFKKNIYRNKDYNLWNGCKIIIASIKKSYGVLCGSDGGQVTGVLLEKNIT